MTYPCQFHLHINGEMIAGIPPLLAAYRALVKSYLKGTIYQSLILVRR